MRFLTRFLAVTFLLVFTTISYPQQKKSSGAAGGFRVENVARKAGVGFRQKNFATEKKYPFETMGGAVAILDYNNDGFPDLFFLNGAPSPQHMKSAAESFNRLYRNKRNGTFEDVTEGSGLSGQGKKGYPQGVAVADYDNNGFPDIYITQFGEGILYHNQGNGTFTDVTQQAGVSMSGSPFKASACWLDADQDGWLDLFVTRYFQWTFEEQGDYHCGEMKPGYRTYCRPGVFKPLANVLYHNNGDGTFTDVSQRAGFNGSLGKGMGVAIADYDNDGHIDIFVTNDVMPNFLYHNQGDSTFKEVAAQAGVYANENGTLVSGMGCEFRDFNNDGLPDIFYTDLVTETFTLFKNLGRGLFQDVTFPSNIGNFSSSHSGWSNRFLDWDNDGWKDIVMAGSHVLDNPELYNPSSRYSEPCFFYRNLANGRFEDLSQQLGPDFQEAGANRGLAVADLDNDGSLEVAVNRLNDSALLFKAQTSNQNNWIILDLRGTRSNRDGIGARIELTTPSGKQQFDHVTTANGIYSASDKRVHFGLGSETQAQSVVIS
jgi:enediyne biosynthesis protein E4